MARVRAQHVTVKRRPTRLALRQSSIVATWIGQAAARSPQDTAAPPEENIASWRSVVPSGQMWASQNVVLSSQHVAQNSRV